jgi:group I intron endonuclease
MSGANHPRFGTTWVVSEDTRAKISSSITGKQVSEDTRKLISDSLKALNLTGSNNPFFGKTHSDDTKAQMSLALSGTNHYNYGKLANNAKTIYVYSLENVLINSFSSKTAVALWLNVTRGTITNYIRSGKVFDGKYYIRDTLSDSI